jgi:ATP-binding cassette subfamily C (CFTR/MRP) protein 1
LISLAVKLRSLISQQIYTTNLTYFAVYSIGCALSVSAFLAEWIWPRHDDRYDALVDEEECPLETATIFSRLTFSWMTALMQAGYKQYLTQDDLWALARSDNTKTTGDLFEEAWQHELKSRKKPNLWFALLRAYGGPYAVAAFFKFFNDISQYIQPQLLRLLITFVDSYREGETPQPAIQGAAIALAMFTVAVFQTSMVVSDFRAHAHSL